MQLDRVEFKEQLEQAQMAVTTTEILEQSNHFVFDDGQVISFSDEILFRSPSLLKNVTACVLASDLMKVVTKLPDETIDISVKDGSMLVKGKNRRVSLTCSEEIFLPYKDIPIPTKWKKVGAEFLPGLVAASRNCGKDATLYLTSCVHVTPDHIEATDNFRFYRKTIPTKVKRNTLIPASTIISISKEEVLAISDANKGWLHVKFGNGAVGSLKCSHEKYIDGVEAILDIDGLKRIKLPSNLSEIIDRAQIMNENNYDASISVKLAKNLITLFSRKESGWYRERKKVKYTGDELSFCVHPKFFEEVLSHTHTVETNGQRMKIEEGSAVFVVFLD